MTSQTRHYNNEKNVQSIIVQCTTSRGGVEDTRLEAKAKDTKKIRGQGQGQPFRGQTHSRPRTQAQVLSKKKKKSSHKFFKRSPKKTFSKKFFEHSTKF